METIMIIGRKDVLALEGNEPKDMVVVGVVEEPFIVLDMKDPTPKRGGEFVIE
jgi:hypothetical protein